MAEFIIMPKLGFNMDEGQLVKWHKAEGDAVKKGEVAFEIQTDKTTIEVESTCDGILRKIFVEEGQTVPVIVPVAVIGDAGEDISVMIAEAAAKLGGSTGIASEQPAAVEENDAPQAAAAAAEAVSSDLKLSPRARKYAAEQGLDLSGAVIPGSGFQGGITQKDLEQGVTSGKITPLAKKMAQAAQVDLANVAGSGVGGKIVKEDILGAVKQAAPAPVGDIEVLRTIDYSGMRKVIGDRLSQSKFTAPHLYFTASVDVTELMKFRETVNKAQPQKVSYNDFVIAAVSQALQKFPAINCALHGNKIVQYKDVNIGMAVGMENGLIVPVIKKAQNKKLTAIAAETQVLAEKARAGKLLPQDYQGGTFTVSNLGMFGIENFTAIINPPEAAILSVSALKKTPVVISSEDGDEIVIKTMMKMTVSVDHRLIDGMNATKFLNEVKALLEKPLTILI
ncbi:Dihydrolipoyllysine-residue acetyltransferase component of pyruvate dehydrogenase complex [Sporomusa rhizae]|uniref:dihydrolipoamide acetyltransferase family protein n=1 Tax=Sporomusa rhizae TaxID=357999 RepID=UPI00352AC756